MGTPLRALIVGDTKGNAEALKRELHLRGYDVTSAQVETASALKEALKDPKWNLAIARCSDGDFTTLEAMRLVQECGLDIPFIIVSGEVQSETAVAVLHTSGKSYVVVHNELGRLLPTIERELRRSLSTEARERAEGALIESEERFRILVESIDEFIWETDARGNYTYASPKARDILGYEPEEMLRKNFFELLDPRETERVTQGLRERGASTDLTVKMEGELVHRDGHRVVVETTSTPFFDSAGELLGYRGVDRDVTERKLAEEERRRLGEQMQQFQKLESLGVMAGGIAHDFNNLLMPILGNAGLVLDELPPETPGRKNIKAIEKAAKRAAELSTQMLAFAGQGSLLTEAIDLSRLIRDMAHLLDVSRSKDVVIRYDLSDDLPHVDADASQVHQIVVNLIANASEAMEESGGFIRVSTGVIEADSEYLANTYVDDDLPAGKYVYLDVSDTGCGMPEEVLEKIFDPFFTTKFTGRGLGLAAVLGIVRGHRGALGIESAVGVGTAFRILFPGIQGDPMLPFVEAPDDGAGWRGKGTVLLVDDEEMVRDIVKDMLEEVGFTVLMASDGKESVEVFRKHADEIVCVLLDLTMPVMTGEVAFGEMRAIRPDLPGILASGYSGTDIMKRYADRGFSGFLQKPFLQEDLIIKLREALARKA